MRSADVTVERGRVDVGGVPISYQAAGQGPSLVLMHGLAGSGRWWVRNVGPLSRHFRVYTIDLIGFGQSRGRHPFVLEEAGDLLAGWMARLGIARAAVVGHSMGGLIAIDLAADFPGRVDRLVLVSAAALSPGRIHGRHALDLLRAVPCLPLGFYPILVADAWRAGPRTILKAARELLGTDVRPKLARIATPTLVVWGRNDTLVPLSVGEQLCAAVAGAKLVVLDRAGHVPMWDQAEAFNRSVMDFLRTQGAVSGMVESLPT